jgi:hypothetical protein
MSDSSGLKGRMRDRQRAVGENPFASKVLPMSPRWSVTYVSGMDLVKAGGEGGIRTPDTGFASITA